MIELLRKVSLFDQMTDEQLEHILSIAQRRTFPAGTVLFHENDYGAAFYVILKGSIKIFKRSAKGEEKVLTLLQSGDSFGELSLIDGRPRSASAATLEPTSVLVIAEQPFHELLRTHYDITRRIMAELCQRLRDTNQHVHDLTFLDSRTRVIKNLILLANRHGQRSGNLIAIRMPLNYDELAQMAGVQKNVLAEVIRDIEDRGILRLSPNEYTLDLSKLQS
ncbi:MAG: Crp/Fnr family transcriptional regulator [Paenibacillaceae bacterium]|nr:MAG: Crp/Fnr family transcriptional regulator [Paenibacillaceae bacterium]